MTYKTLIVAMALAVAVAGVRAQISNQAFVTKMGGVGTGEVDLGRLAKDKASNDKVKAFAQRMIDDHSKATDELKSVAQRKNLTWPTGPGADAVALKDKLSKLSGAAFDRAYIDAMVNAHREVLGVVRGQSQSAASDAEVKAWATKATTSVQAHLTHAQDVQREVGRTATH